MAQALLPAAVMTAVSLVFSVLLVTLGRKFAVHAPPGFSEVRELLPGINCGACGFAGCDEFAKALAEGRAEYTACRPLSPKGAEGLSQLLGGGSGVEQETVAVVACNGGNDCENKYDYQGYGDCRSAELLAGGIKACPSGCIGKGTCVDVCHFFAIEVNGKGVAEVARENCVSCGFCIKDCPKGIIRRIPRSAKVYINCSTYCKANDVRSICKTGCIACGICARVCPENAIEMVDNLPVIDYKKCTGCEICAQKCPVKCIAIVPQEEAAVSSAG